MSEQNKPIISIDKVSHVYSGGKKALDDVSLDIGVGLFGLLGANGAGKSTLMRIMCTLLEPSEGQVSVCGNDVVTNRLEARRVLGYLPQDFGAWDAHSVENILDTLAILSGMHDPRQRTDRIAEVLEAVGLSEVAGRKVKKLSGGMLRRLGVAQALVHSPSVLVLDEPTVGLDPEERLRFRQMVTELGRDRIVVLSTHIIADLGSGCSDIALVHEGCLEFRGSPVVLIDQAHGKVLEITLDASADMALDTNPDFEAVGRYYRDGESVIRGVAKSGFSAPGAVPAQNITLEEAYLSFELGQGRSIDTIHLDQSS